MFVLYLNGKYHIHVIILVIVLKGVKIHRKIMIFKKMNLKKKKMEYVLFVYKKEYIICI